jgi:hypothetical protein
MKTFQVEVPNFSDEELGYVDFLDIDRILSDSHNNDYNEFHTDEKKYMFIREITANPFLSVFMAHVEGKKNERSAACLKCCQVVCGAFTTIIKVPR